MEYIQDRIVSFLTANHFRSIPLVNLITKDQHLFFTNSATCAYMSYIKNGSCVHEKLYCIQPSLRNHNLKLYSEYSKNNQQLSHFSFFHQLGLLETGRLGSDSILLVIQLLVEVLELRSEEVIIILPADYAQFSSLFTENFSARNIKVTTNKHMTTWNYGDASLLGQSIVFCTIDPSSKRLINICDLVEIHNQSADFSVWEFCISIEFIEKILNQYTSILQISNYRYLFDQPLAWNNTYTLPLEIFGDAFHAYLQIMKHYHNFRLTGSLNNSQLSVLRKYFKYFWVYSRQCGMHEEELYTFVEHYIEDKAVCSFITDDIAKRARTLYCHEQQYERLLLTTPNPLQAMEQAGRQLGLLQAQIEGIHKKLEINVGGRLS
ncbi:hypothetical protein [Paenibacillus typhae]|uniref:hypothetical protein n=1 Tax=Paenibacillus typhae TaxID=1174501 RepID=UPI001C8ED835|nr:hypothetical protein [Paenibacillus typhae]MBY0009768.1 hypothetical protein [Paenibacillus typhae]